MKKIIMILICLISIIKTPIYAEPFFIGMMIALGVTYFSTIPIAIVGLQMEFESDDIIENYLIPINPDKINLNKQNYKKQFIIIRVIEIDVDTFIQEELSYINSMNKTSKYKLIENKRTKQYQIENNRIYIYYKIVKREIND